MTDEDTTTVEIDDGTLELVEAYRAAKARAKSESEAAAALHERIMVRLRTLAPTEPEHVVGTWSGEPIVTMRVVWTSRLDTEKLRKSAPSVVDEYSVSRPSVRLILPVAV